MWEVISCLSVVAGGIYAILTDQNKLVVAVGGATALAAGVYTTRSDSASIAFFSNICFSLRLDGMTFVTTDFCTVVSFWYAHDLAIFQPDTDCFHKHSA